MPLNYSTFNDTLIRAIGNCELGCLINYIGRWIDHNRNNQKNRYFHDGRWWTNPTVAEMAANGVFASLKKTRRLLNKLIEAGLLFVRRASIGSPAYYSLNEEKLEQLLNGESSGQIDPEVKMTTAKGQNDHTSIYIKKDQISDRTRVEKDTPPNGQTDPSQKEHPLEEVLSLLFGFEEQEESIFSSPIIPESEPIISPVASISQEAVIEASIVDTTTSSEQGEIVTFLEENKVNAFCGSKDLEMTESEELRAIRKLAFGNPAKFPWRSGARGFLDSAIQAVYISNTWKWSVGNNKQLRNDPDIINHLERLEKDLKSPDAVEVFAAWTKLKLYSQEAIPQFREEKQSVQKVAYDKMIEERSALLQQAFEKYQKR